MSKLSVEYCFYSWLCLANWLQNSVNAACFPFCHLMLTLKFKKAGSVGFAGISAHSFSFGMMSFVIQSSLFQITDVNSAAQSQVFSRSQM